jgi:hypothetical protein
MTEPLPGEKAVVPIYAGLDEFVARAEALKEAVESLTKAQATWLQGQLSGLLSTPDVLHDVIGRLYWLRPELPAKVICIAAGMSSTDLSKIVAGRWHALWTCDVCGFENKYPCTSRSEWDRVSVEENPAHRRSLCAGGPHHGVPRTKATPQQPVDDSVAAHSPEEMELAELRAFRNRTLGMAKQTYAAARSRE